MAGLSVGCWSPCSQVLSVRFQWLVPGYIKIHSYETLKKHSQMPTLSLAVFPHNAHVFSLQKAHKLSITYSFSFVSHSPSHKLSMQGKPMYILIDPMTPLNRVATCYCPFSGAQHRALLTLAGIKQIFVELSIVSAYLIG